MWSYNKYILHYMCGYEFDLCTRVYTDHNGEGMDGDFGTAIGMHDGCHCGPVKRVVNVGLLFLCQRIARESVE